MRQKLLLIAAVFFGILAFVLTYQQIQAEKKRILGQAIAVDLIQLTSPIAGGEVIQKKHITKKRVQRLANAQELTREIPWRQYKMILGRKLETSMLKGAILQWDDLEPASQRQSGLTGVIAPGTRAVTISVDSVSSINNLVKPGDHVDLIGTFRFPEMRGDRSLDTITMTILQDVTILACGSDFGKYSYNEKPVRSRGYNTVTLELYPEEVDMIIFASQKGRLSLTLRNYEESKIIHELPSINFKYLEQNISKFNLEREKRRRLR